MQTITTPEGQEITKTKAEDFQVGDRTLAYGGAIVTDIEHIPATEGTPRYVLMTTRHPHGVSENLHCAWNTLYRVVA